MIIRALTQNLLALSTGVLFALLLAEVITRFAMPISSGTYKIDNNGQRVELHHIAPDQSFRQFSAEFNASTKITKDGYRYPESVGNPEVVFIGDSFTYGLGLSDDETFVMQYCRQANLQCMNLGVPGFGTIDAVERLEDFLRDKQTRPRKVYLVMLAMSTFLGAGNDLDDNIKISTLRRSQQGHDKEYNEALIRKISNELLRISNLARVVKFNFSPIIKSKLVVTAGGDELKRALQITRESLLKLKQLAIDYNFSAEVILIHPMQDIYRGTDNHTLTTISSITDLTIIPSASYFKPDPAKYYYPIDGHFNIHGSQRMVKLLHSLK